jgi:hypothetical protein
VLHDVSELPTVLRKQREQVTHFVQRLTETRYEACVAKKVSSRRGEGTPCRLIRIWRHRTVPN